MAGVPANAQVIWDYLIGKGASNNAAAGILGNIEQESGGDPAAGPWPQQYGLIQWTPPTNYFSSPPSLAQQLPAIIAYIDANGGMADINAHASTPSEAAVYFSQKYERPNAAEANNENRSQSAELVLTASKNGWKGATNPITTGTTTGSTTGAQSASGNLVDTNTASWWKQLFTDPFGAGGKLGDEFDKALGLPTLPGMKTLTKPITETGKALSGLTIAANDFVTFIGALFRPTLWLRVGAFLIGIVGGGAAVYLLATANR